LIFVMVKYVRIGFDVADESEHYEIDNIRVDDKRVVEVLKSGDFSKLVIINDYGDVRLTKIYEFEGDKVKVTFYELSKYGPEAPYPTEKKEYYVSKNVASKVIEEIIKILETKSYSERNRLFHFYYPGLIKANIEKTMG